MFFLLFGEIDMHEYAMRSAGRYLADMERNGRTAKTIKSYRTAIYSALRFLEEQGMTTDPREIGEDEALAMVQGYPASETTVRYYLYVLGHWTASEGNTGIKDMRLLWNRESHPNVRWIDPQEFARITDALQDPTDRIIVMLAAYAGMRRAEIASLRLADIYGDRMVVTGKGHGKGKQRVIPMSDRLRAEIARYMAFRRDHVSDSEVGALVYVTINGTDPRGITAGTVGRRLRRVCERAGVDATAHSFRRYFATRIWDTMPDKDIRVLQDLLGHSSPDMTCKYIRRNESAMARAMGRI